MAPKPFDAVFFDLDGTLADSAEDIGLALRRAFQDLRLPVTCPIESLIDGSPLEEIFAVVAPEGTAGDFAQFAASYRQHYDANDHRLTRIYPGVRETLEALGMLQPRPRLAIVTAKRATNARSLASVLDIERFFDRIEGSGGTSLPPKPAPDLLLAVARSLEVAPARTLMVGDTLRDLEAGRAAGMATAVVLYGFGARDALLEARPDHVLEDLEDLLPIVAAPGRTLHASGSSTSTSS